MNNVDTPQLAIHKTATIVGAVKTSENLPVSHDSELQGEALNTNQASPIRVRFTIQYTDLGLDRMYGELAALTSNLERTKHIKRCLHDIVRGDFKRPTAARHVFGDHDRESFKVQISFSSRDVGLEAVFNELKPLQTTFKRNNVLRQKLFDAFNLTSAVAPGSTAFTTLSLQTETAPSLSRDPIAIDSRSVSYASMATTYLEDHSTVSDRRRAARQANAVQFDLT